MDEAQREHVEDLAVLMPPRSPEESGGVLLAWSGSQVFLYEVVLQVRATLPTAPYRSVHCIADLLLPKMFGS